MKFSCKRQKFEKAVLAISRFVGSKSTSNFPEGIFIGAKNNTLFFKGYNLEIGATTEIFAEVSVDGTIVLPSKILCDIAKKTSGEEIKLDVSESFLATVTSENSKFLVAGIDPKNYPELPNVETLEKITLNHEKLKDMIKQTVFAAAANSTESDPVYTGVLFEIKDKKIRLVALDGYRMAIREEDVDTDKTAYFIIPSKTLTEILKLDPQNEAISIIIGKSHVLFEILGFRIVSRLIEGKFLDYKSSTPKTFLSQVVLSVSDFIKAVERVCLVTNDASKTPIRLVFKEGALKIFCSTGSGKASDEIKADLQGDIVEIGVNGKYLLEALRSSEFDQIKLQMNGPLSPVKLVPVKTEEFVFLVLPVRLKTEEVAV